MISFTQDHWAALKRHGTQRVWIAYDRDDAGNAAAETLGTELREAGIETFRVLFPKGMDANEYAKKVAPVEKSLGLLLSQSEWIGKGKRVVVAALAEPETLEKVNDVKLASSLAAIAEPAVALAPVKKASAAKKEAVSEVKSEPALVPEVAPPVVFGDDLDVKETANGELVFTFGERSWRIRGWQKNLGPEQMRVNAQVRRGDAFHVDTLDVYSAKARAVYLKTAAIELGSQEDTLKRDLGRMLLKLEALQDEAIRKTLAPADASVTIDAVEHAAALEWLKAPDLIARLEVDMARCGVVGETTNLLAGYLAAVSRKLDAPLAVLIQSSSAAGKSALMDAVLDLMAVGNTLTIHSGRDTTLDGAVASGNAVSVDVGRDLTMTSAKDTSYYADRQSSVAGGLNIGTNGASGSASASRTKIDSNFDAVGQQTGIVAGDGGFDVNVAGHTQLNGAQIASSAAEDKNTFTTGSLSFSNIDNTFESSGSTAGVTLNTSTVGGPQAAQTSDNANGTTYAAISPGTITVKVDEASGTDSTAGLSRDTTNANETVQNTFNLRDTQNDLAFAQAFGKTATYAMAEAAGTLAKSNPDAFGEGKPGRDAMHGAVAAIGAAISGGNIAGAVGGSLTGDALTAFAQPIIDQAVSGSPAGSQQAARDALNVVVATAGRAAAGTLAGGLQGALAGAGASSNNERFNRQLHQPEKTKAQQIAAAAKAQGLTNADGSPITAAQIENSMRAANNSQYGEIAATGVVVPLNGNTPVGVVYDTTGMKMVTDSTGNYLVQDPSMLATQSKALQDLITQNTGGASSPYSWGASTSQAAAPKIDPYGPFSPAQNGCITAECAAGIANSDPRNDPNVTVQAGFHVPISPGISVGPNFSYTANDGTASIKPDIAIGSLGDAGANIGFYGDPRYSGPSAINFGIGKYLGAQITPSNVTAWNEKSWYDPTRYMNGVSVGIGAGFSTPISGTVDPTYESPGKK